MPWEMLPVWFGRALRFIYIKKSWWGGGSFRGSPRVPSGGAVRGRSRKETRKKLPSGALDGPACKEQIHDGMWWEGVRWGIRFGCSGLEFCSIFLGGGKEVLFQSNFKAGFISMSQLRLPETECGQKGR